MTEKKTNEQERIILGVDPGTTILGYGLIRILGKNPELMVLGSIELKKYDDHYIKLKTIFERITQLIDEFHPDELSIEAPFYGKNVQSMLKLGRAQGVAMSAALQRSIPIFEYAPRKIKMSITGRGSASKEQVALTLQKILKIKKLPQNLDATDGLAAALCHYYQTSVAVVNTTTPYKSWKDFINQNTKRVKKN
ncbi:MAG: crossover junction endodeoxyribonuclease RuvC [Prevotellaceae bacterium]|jgi:crossover junction endodeoxyribonuclease RuvC|nr:crossover junction endodeoxyribonuclease RuvC [Prevotellaceae bacterium]